MNFQPSLSDAITIVFNRKPLTVRLGGTVLAESSAAITVREPGHPERVYFPHLDVKMTHLIPSDKSTTCPHKGRAEYFDIAIKGSHRPNLAWSYPAVKLALAEISGYIAFFDDPELTISGSASL